MRQSPVCAVVVSYHPPADLTEYFPSILAQVDGLVIVDNGSTLEEVASLRAASMRHGFCLIENAGNLGVAEALNQATRWAKGQGYGWVLFLDQDSRITNGFVDQMFAAWNAHPKQERIAAVHPRYVDPVTGNEPFVRRANDGGPVISMTSGSLLPTWIFDKIGWFASEYFIDCVDFEYCFRIRAAGYLIADSKQAVLLHASGQAKRGKTLLGFTFRPTHYNASRRYYISRNRVALYRRYFRVFPRWVLQSMYDGLRETVKCFLSEQDRMTKFRSFLLGTWDGLTNRMGKRDLRSEFN
ncbi:MAG TPA: glycosyltransferase family 2 protein [Terriglobales bacterium]|jgi:rhamnosyltransferase